MAGQHENTVLDDAMPRHRRSSPGSPGSKRTIPKSDPKTARANILQFAWLVLSIILLLALVAVIVIAAQRLP
jgi:hypothetical protein